MLRKVALLTLLSLSAASATGLYFPIIPHEFNEDNKTIASISVDIANEFSKEYIQFMKTGVESAMLKQLSTQLAKAHSKDMISTSISEMCSVDKFVMCTTCRAATNIVAKIFRSENGELHGPNAGSIAKKIVLELCERFKIQTLEVCSGLVDLHWPVIQYIILNTKADARSFCGTLPINFCKVKQEIFNWSIKIDKRKGPLKAPKSKVPKKTENDLTVVQLTDIHFDPEYKAGSLAACDELLCCRLNTTNKLPNKAKAGYWSDYRKCDAPLYLIENAFDNINEAYEKIDFIYHTGDIVPHNVWSTTKEGNKEVLTKIQNLIEDKFPGIPVYPCVGNHEPHPANLFGMDDVPEEFSSKWLYEHLWNLWKRWLPAESKETVLKGGYYTVSPKKGFRIISVNNNDCYSFNWWIYLNGGITSKPQLDWLQKTLLAAEKAGEHVHILKHIPSGNSDCWSVWAREYNRIIERYSHIIGGIFGGHTHRDEMNLYYSQNGHAMAIYWNGGSLTTYANKNPNYRVYEVEPVTYQVVDHHTWIFNVTEANGRGENHLPRWFKEYQFTEFTQDLSPAGLDALFERMAAEPKVLLQYWRYFVTSADPRLEAGCDEKCLSKIICRLVTTIYNNKTRCNELKAKLRKSLKIEQ